MNGLLSLLDDVVALTKLAAATIDDAAGQAARAGVKAAGVVIDDVAVTPRYVTGLAAQRENAVSVMITAAVYGVVALVVKADDVGARLALRGGPVSGGLGRALVHGMPPFLEVLSFIGTLAMLWVGGGILLHGLAEYGFTALEHAIDAASEIARGALPLVGGVLAWLIAAAVAAAIGLVVGAFTGIVVSTVSAAFKIREK
jgi:predicted DNA repair protein MutK